MRRAIAVDAATGDGGVALISAAGKVLATETVGSPDPEWAPEDALPLSAGYNVTAARARSGGAFSYATQPIAGSDFFVVERFSNAPRHSAQRRFLALALAPLLLAAFCFVFGRAMQGELLQGIDAIKSAMLARSPDQAPELAPEDAQMPLKLREFVAAYNAMARESASHEESLHASVLENQFLLRELNHRVKSSLQIIQSYLSLTRRLDRRSGHHTSAAAIEARVQVLSTAYRKAFSEGRMRDVRIRQFAEEIVLFLSQMFEPPGMTIELKANVAAALVIDRAIPLGLAMVESLIAGMSAEGAHFVVLQIDQVEDLRVEMRVWTDGVLRPDAPNAKLMGGLALQLAAIVEASGSGTIMHWRFQGRPPPIFCRAAICRRWRESGGASQSRVRCLRISATIRIGDDRKAPIGPHSQAQKASDSSTARLLSSSWRPTIAGVTNWPSTTAVSANPAAGMTPLTRSGRATTPTSKRMQKLAIGPRIGMKFRAAASAPNPAACGMPAARQITAVAAPRQRLISETVRR